jgi:hypothetical protein
MMGGRRSVFRLVSRLVDLPVVGSALYRLNVNQPMIRMMARGHVYADPGWLDERRLGEKLAATNAPGARHASFRFVAGELDLMSTREQFLATVVVDISDAYQFNNGVIGAYRCFGVVRRNEVFVTLAVEADYAVSGQVADCVILCRRESLY